MKNIKVGDECYMSSYFMSLTKIDHKYKRKILAITSDGHFVTECINNNDVYIEKWEFAFLVPKIEPYNRETFPKEGAWVKLPRSNESLVLFITDEGVGTHSAF